MEKLLSKNPALKYYLEWFGILVTIIIIGAEACDNWYDKANTNEIIHTIKYILVVLLFISFINHYFLSRVYYNYKQRESFLSKELSEISNNNIQDMLKKYSKPSKIKFDRFEFIKSKKELIYGYVEYKPFFWKNELVPNGIGLELLKKIFCDFNDFILKPFNYPARKKGNNWTDVFADLCEKKFDIIMTPLFETRSRLYSYNILYCAPIFYSNIGIYVRKNSFTNCDKMKFKDALNYLRRKIEDGWKAESIPGELSESLLTKYELGTIDKTPTEQYIYPATDEDFAKILQNVNRDGGNKGDFVFMEVFKANMIINTYPTEFNLVNILEENQLLYPVSFVVRKEETVLKNLINLRLMELRQNGELEKIIKFEALKVNIKETEFNEIFIQNYDFTKLTT